MGLPVVYELVLLCQFHSHQYFRLENRICLPVKSAASSQILCVVMYISDIMLACMAAWHLLYKSCVLACIAYV